MQLRSGSTDDLPHILSLFDDNIAWLVEQGRSEQRGREPLSGNPKMVDFIRDLLASGTVTIAEIDGEAVGASVVADHPMPYVPAGTEEERYLKLLLTSPAHRGKKIGHRLIELARELTVAENVGLLRVDCWSGGDRRLVDYYLREGFTATEEIEVRPGTSVQVFEWRPSPDPDRS
ncbi:MAG: GNAT family N-acetyltransferase [Thermomicrobiales bacterium]